MHKLTIALLINCIITLTYGMEKTMYAKETQTDDPWVYRVGSHLADCPRVHYKLASVAQEEATLAQENNYPQQEIDTYFQMLRWHLTQALESQKTLQEKGELQGRLTHEEYNFVRLWMTELLANGWGGARDFIQAKKLCEETLKDAPPLQSWAQTMLEQLNRECSQHPE